MQLSPIHNKHNIWIWIFLNYLFLKLYPAFRWILNQTSSIKRAPDALFNNYNLKERYYFLELPCFYIK